LRVSCQYSSALQSVVIVCFKESEIVRGHGKCFL
jgi:hypothetical protein